MRVRNFQAGDEAVQVAIYNSAAASLPKFKPATVQEVQRRVRAKDFDPGQRFYAEENGREVGYCTFTANGRISYPWCLDGYQKAAFSLFEAALAEMKRRGLKQTFAAYRGDWPVVLEFFRLQGFRHARDMINYVIDLLDVPTVSMKSAASITPIRLEDVDALFALAAEALRVKTATAFREHLFHNPYFPPDALFALRRRNDNAPIALGILVNEATYADPKALDAAMPCFRLGAFGTETMAVKRVRGLVSFLAKPDQTLPALAMELLSNAVQRLATNDPLECLAAQTPSDMPAWVAFYERHFRRQGSFPVFELDL